MGVLELERFWKIHDTIMDWTKHCDTKAEVLVVLNTAIASFTFLKIIEKHSFIVCHGFVCTFTILALIFWAVSLWYSLSCIKPNLGTGNPVSLIFFRHIAEKYTNYESYYNDLNGCNDDEFKKKEITQQIWINSIIANKKYIKIVRATWAFILFFIFSGVAIIAYIHN